MEREPTRSRLVAVLGPTNTGKTHFAMERMLGHASGMIGFPLRLLARENYERAVAAKGTGQVALITGEEKIVPPGARYFLCTVESMPLARRVAFLGVDEIQMAADPDRGHVFTDRLFHARGEAETMFMGAETAKPLLRNLLPGIEISGRPRLSTLSHTGPRKPDRLPPRSAVVAFSAADVYALAELVRRQRGGTAVVLGALSPRARNAQVAMYQAGEVDYLVATDAIGMGLNMDVDHVAFAATRKFDGRVPRALLPAELAQIAGRAGRSMNHGTFGTTLDIPPFDEETVERLENHRFDPLRHLFWRNSELGFTSVEALKRSLARPPERPGLVRAREADDERILEVLSREDEVRRAATGPEAVRLLWDVCQVPDFRKVMSDAHARLLGRIYGYLGTVGRLPTDWVAKHVAEIDRIDGDMDVLMQRIASIRTWTYVSYQGGWVADGTHWQERTRAIEDKLSDALHERLTHRFVDKRTAVLVRRLKSETGLLAAVRASGEVLVEGHPVGRMEGFRFVADVAPGNAAKRVAGAARRALGQEVESRLRRLEADPDEAFAHQDGRILWRGQAVGRLGAGAEVLRPAVAALPDLLLDGEERERLRRRLAAWMEARVATVLGPLLAAEAAASKGAPRGLVFRLRESLGSLPRAAVEDGVEALGRPGRAEMKSLGIRIGRESVFLPALLKPAAVAFRAVLWSVAHARTVLPPPPPGRVSVAVGEGVPPAFYEACGYRPLGGLAVRIDILERLSARAWSLARTGPFVPGPDLLSLAGCGASEMVGILAGLGFRAGAGEPPAFRPRRPRPRAERPPRSAGEAHSPFARLRDLGSGR